MQVANPNRAQFTKCAGYAIPYTTVSFLLEICEEILEEEFGLPDRWFARYVIDAMLVDEDNKRVQSFRNRALLGTNSG